MIELKPLYRALHFLSHGVGCPYRTSAEQRAYRHADLEKGGDGYLWASSEYLVKWNHPISLRGPYVALVD